MTTNTYLYPSNSSFSALTDITELLARNNVKKALEILNTVDMKHCINDTIRENKPGWTLLHDACYNGIHDLCLQLILKGANVNCRDSTGSTPLHDAVRHGHIKCIKILFDNGANIDIRTSTGETALDIASGFPNTCKIKTDICNCLLKQRKKHLDSQSSNSSSQELLHSIEGNNRHIKKLESDVRNNKGQIQENKEYYCKGYSDLTDHLKLLEELSQYQIQQIQELKEQLQRKCCCGSKIKANSENADAITAATRVCSTVQHNFLLLTDRLRADEHMYHMFQDKYLKDSDIDEIQSKHGDQNQVRKMLRILLKSRNPMWVYCFRDSLKNNDSTNDLVEKIWGDDKG